MNHYRTKAILEFFKKVQAQESKMKGFMVMDSLENQSESIVLTFWKTKEDMDKFYQVDNNLLSDLVEKLKPSFETLPERRGYRRYFIIKSSPAKTIWKYFLHG